MDLGLKKKVFVVTGGASGIGKSIVEKLVAEDAIPCIIDRDQQAVADISAYLKNKNKKFYAAVIELTEFNSCKNTIDTVIKEFGQIDGLINNAGVNDGVSLEDGSYELFLNSLNNNVAHYYLMAQIVLNELKLSRGSIVNICSKVAQTGQGSTSGYAAANGVRFELTTEWAHELSAFGIRVNAVVVAECLTPQYEWWINKQPDPEKSLNAIKSKIPFEKRMTTPDEIAETVLFLLSFKSGPVSGKFFYVDGGYVHLDRKI